MEVEGFQSWKGVEVHFAFALGVAWILEFTSFVKNSPEANQFAIKMFTNI